MSLAAKQKELHVEQMRPGVWSKALGTQWKKEDVQGLAVGSPEVETTLVRAFLNTCVSKFPGSLEAESGRESTHLYNKWHRLPDPHVQRTKAV